MGLTIATKFGKILIGTVDLKPGTGDVQTDKWTDKQTDTWN